MTTLKKIETAFDTLSNDLEEKEKKDKEDEEVLLQALLKLMIMKKASIMHIREMEENMMVDLKL